MKKIPGSTEYLIDLNGQIFDSFERPVCFKRDNSDNIEIELFQKKRKVPVTWVKLLAWYEVDSINNLSEYIDNIRFVPICPKTVRSRCGYTMVFTEPLYYKEGFRYIPNYPHFAISINGEVIDTLTNKVIIERFISTDGYECVYIREPDKNKNRHARIHRLLALAWIPNNDFVNKPIINHIDGNKTNNQIENLEWCSYSHNSRHALTIGLNKTEIKMKTRDVVTGEVVIYRSAAELAHKLGTTSICGKGYASKLPGYLFKKRYEIKLFDDDTPWFYENKEYNPERYGKSFYTITVFNKKTGEKTEYGNVRFFYKKYKLHVKSNSLEEAIVFFREKFPDHEVSYKRNSVAGPYRVIDLETNETSVFSSIIEAGRYINRSRTELQYDLSREFKFIYSDKWIVVPGFKDLTIEEYRKKPNAFNSVEILNTATGEITVARSMKHVEKLTRIRFGTVTKYINTGKEIKGLIFRTLE